jgi:hypothetical protein
MLALKNFQSWTVQVAVPNDMLAQSPELRGTGGTISNFTGCLVIALGMRL